MARLKLIEMDTDNRLIYFRKDDKLIAFDADVAIELISDSLDGKYVDLVRCKDCKKYIPCQKLPIGTSKWCNLFDRATCEMNYCGWGERREDELLVTDKD